MKAEQLGAEKILAVGKALRDAEVPTPSVSSGKE